jgi:hypothetical protein
LREETRRWEEEKRRGQHARMSISFGVNEADNAALVPQAPVLRNALHAQRRQHTIASRAKDRQEQQLQSERGSFRAEELRENEQWHREGCQRQSGGETPPGLVKPAATPRKGKIGLLAVARELATRSLSPRHGRM